MSMGSLFSRKGSNVADPKALREDDGSREVVAVTDLAARVKLLDSFEQSGLGWFWATDRAGRITYMSQSAVGEFGKSRDELIGMQLVKLVKVDDEEDTEKASRPIGFLFSSRTNFSDLTVHFDVDGDPHWWSISGRAQTDENGRFTGYSGAAKDITSVRQRQVDASRLAQYDSLTGLSNRHRMSKRLTATLSAHKVAKRSCALMMMDLDRFKQVNDTLGHPAGDELLRQVAQRLGQIIGSTAEIGRLGGDEFQVILPDMDDRGELGELADRIIQMVSQPYSIEGSRAIIGTSVGIAIAPYDGVDAEELVSSADLALYAAKGGGRGQFRFYSSDLKDSANRRREIDGDLRDAILQEELSLHYQPIVRISDHTVSCFEALMRWEHPERGRIGPDEFIPIAEETGLINELGGWALRRACEDAMEWSETVRVAVNVSAVQFGAHGFVEAVADTLSATGLQPGRLELEITESVFLGDQQAAKRIFADLKALGVRLALDDFGTGYSSLAYLSNAPFDKIKIDQGFVRGATEEGNNNTAIISAIVSLAQALDMETVAEGVESMDVLKLIGDLQASHVQGYIFSKPMPQEEVLPHLEESGLAYEPTGPAKHRSERRTVYRKVSVIHEDHCYDVVMRNLSRSGAAIEGLLDVPVDTDLVLDLGGGQLVVSKVKRSDGYSQGLKFEMKLVSDGNDNLCTRHRISPYSLAAAGMPLAKLPTGNYEQYADPEGKKKTRPHFLMVDTTTLNSAKNVA